MDLSRLTDADFEALKAGNLPAISDAGFAELLKSTPKDVQLQNKTNAELSKIDPTRGMSSAELAAAGAGKFISDTGKAIVQVIPGSPITRATVDEDKRLDAPLMRTTAGKVGYMGAAAVPAAIAAMAPGGQSLGGSIGYGMLQGAAAPVGTNDSVAANALWGGAGGAGGYAFPNALAAMASPKVQPAQKFLIDAGVTLTPGQRLGGGWKRAEDAITSMPVVGDVVRNAQMRATQGFDAAVANRALGPIKASLPNGVTGRDAVKYVESALGNAYDSVLRRVGTLTKDPAFDSEIAQLTASVKASTLPVDVQNQFLTAIKNQIQNKFQGQGVMTAQTFKDAESELGRLASKYAGDPSADKQLLGDALTEAQAALRRLLERGAGPDVAADAKAANQGWAEFKRMQRAAGMQGSRDGVFSAEAYQNSVRALDKSKDKGAFARGNALGQDLSDAGVNVLGRTVPDSGTPFRSLVSQPVNGLVSTIVGSPVMLAYGSPRVQNALQVLMSGQRPALATKAAAELQMLAPALEAMGVTGANVYQRSNVR